MAGRWASLEGWPRASDELVDESVSPPIAAAAQTSQWVAPLATRRALVAHGLLLLLNVIVALGGMRGMSGALAPSAMAQLRREHSTPSFPRVSLHENRQLSEAAADTTACDCSTTSTEDPAAITEPAAAEDTAAAAEEGEAAAAPADEGEATAPADEGETAVVVPMEDLTSAYIATFLVLGGSFSVGFGLCWFFGGWNKICRSR